MQMRALSIKAIRPATDTDIPDDAYHLDYGVIDPYNPSESSQLFFEGLTKDLHVGKLFAPGRYLGTSDDNQIFYFELVNASIGVSRNQHGVISCVMYNNKKDPLEQSLKSKLFAVEGKIIYRFDDRAGFRFEKNHGKRVIKQTASESAYSHKAQLWAEFHLSKELPHVGARPPLILQGQTYPITAASTQKKKAGFNLFDFMPTQATFPISQGKSDYTLTTLDCLEIVLEMFEQAEIQLNDVVHRDLKPENMIIDKHPVEGWIIHIIDYETSRKTDKPDHQPIGTVLYVAPEIYRGISSTASDICSLGMTACYILHDSDFVNQYLKTMEEMRTYRQSNHWSKDFNKLLNEHITAPNEVREIIIALLTSCTQFDPKARPTIQTCISEMQRAVLQYQQQTAIIPAGSHKLTDNALQAARNIRATQPTNYSSLTAESITNLIQDIKQASIAFHHDTHAMRIFSRALRQYCIRGINNQELLIEKLELINENFFTASQVITDLHTRLSEVLAIRNERFGADTITIKLTEQIASLSAFQATIAKIPGWNFDALLAATERMISKSLKEERSLNAYQETIAEFKCRRPGGP